MTKKFCDLCDAPAEDARLETETKWGKPYLGGGSGSPTNSMKQCVITTSLRFGFRAHSSGFGGPPDLCRPCMKKLAQQLVDNI